MLRSAVFCVLVAVTNAQFPGTIPPNLPSTCAATLCVQGTICREVLDRVTGIVQAQCLSLSQQKPGQCPVQQPGSVGICANTCGTDSDCQGAQKCCRNPCGAQTCQNPAQLTPGVPQGSSCANVRCGLGQTCVLQNVQCARAPCYPQPMCVASAVTKSGTCPRLGRGGCGPRCQTDGGCPGTSKCCRSFFCGQTCQQPLELQQQQQTQFTCANVRCQSGFVCQDTPTPCFVAPCPTRPVCTRTLVINAPGQCPAFPAYTFPNCVRRDQCFAGNGFSTCPPGTLCCSTPCGRQCLRGQ